MKILFPLMAALAVFFVAAMVAAMAAHVGNNFGALLMLTVGAMGAVGVLIVCND